MKLLALTVLVSALSAPPTQIIELDTGEVLRATVIEQTRDLVIIDHPVLGRLELPVDRVKSIKPMPTQGQPPPPEGEAPAAPPPAPAPAPDPAPAPTPPPPAPPEEPRWKWSFDLGFSGTAGNTQNTDLRLAFTGAYKAPTQSYLFDTSYYLSTSRGDTTSDQATAGILADWAIQESRWSYFAQGRLDYDTFQSWTERLTGGGGLGYLIIDEDTVDAKGQTVDALTLRARMGLGGRKEWGSDDDDIALEGIAGLTTTWRISEVQNLIGGVFLYPTLLGPDQVRVTLNAEWALSLADVMRGLQLKLGLAYEYQHVVDPGRDHNDLNAYTTLGVAF